MYHNDFLLLFLNFKTVIEGGAQEAGKFKCEGKSGALGVEMGL